MKISRLICAVNCLALGLALAMTACGRKKEPAPPVASAPAVAPAAPRAPIRPDPARTAVTVDGFAITWGQVLGEMQRLQPNSQTSVSAQQAADNLVIRHLLELTADKTHIVVSQLDIKQAVDRVRRQVPTNTTLEAVMLSNNVSQAEFQKSIVDTLKVNLLVQQQVQKVAVATDAEIKQFVKDNPNVLSIPENVVVRTILVGVRPDDTAAIRKTKKARAENIRQQVLGGGNFATLAPRSRWMMAARRRNPASSCLTIAGVAPFWGPYTLAAPRGP